MAVKYTYSITSAGVQVAFEAKPPVDILACLKGHGFRWSTVGRCWWRRRVSGAATVLQGIDSLLARGEPRRPDGQCWACGSENGYFRNRGAAAPVWCDSCNARALAQDEAAQRGATDEARARIAADDFDLANNRSL